MIKAAIFDLGNVLVFFDHQQMLQQISNVCKIDLDKVYEEVIVKQLGIQYELGMLGTDEIYEHLRGLSLVKPSDDELFQAIGDIFKLNTPLVSLVQSLKKQQIRLVILSNTCENHIEMIRRQFSILDDFDEHVFSYEVKARKPDSTIFKKAVELAGCSPHECFYTDDIPEFVHVARELGLDAEQFTTPESLEKQLYARRLL